MSWVALSRGSTLESPFIYSIGSDVKSIFYNNRQCEPSSLPLPSFPTCPSGSSLDFGVCRQNCPPGYMMQGNQCVAIPQIRYTVPQIPEYKQFSCPSGYTMWGGRCYIDCPTGGVRTLTNTCAFFDPPRFETNASLEQNIPISYECPAGRHAVGEFCYTDCPVNTSAINAPLPACRQDCPPGSASTDVTCTPQPSPTTRNEVSKLCSAGQTLNSAGLCVSSCPSSFDAQSPLVFYRWLPTGLPFFANSILYDTTQRPDGKDTIYVVGADGLVYVTLYGFVHNFNVQTLPPALPYFAGITDLFWNTDGRLFLAINKTELRVSKWSYIDGDTIPVNAVTASGQALKPYRFGYDPVNNRHILVTAEGLMYYSTTPYIYPASSWTFTQYPKPVRVESVSFDPFDGKLVVIGYDGLVYKALTTDVNTEFVALGNSGKISFLFYPNAYTNCADDFTTSPNTDYPGNNLAVLNLTPDMCCDTCEADPLCIGYVTSGNLCAIKSNQGQPSLTLGQTLGIASPNNLTTSYVKKQPYQDFFMALYSGVNYTGNVKLISEPGSYTAFVGFTFSLLVGKVQVTIGTAGGRNVVINGPAQVTNLASYIVGQLPAGSNTLITSVAMYPIPPTETQSPTTLGYPCAFDASGKATQYCTNSSWPFIIPNQPDIAVGGAYVIPGSCVPLGPSGNGAMECPLNGEWNNPAVPIATTSNCAFGAGTWNVPGTIAGTQLMCGRNSYKADPTNCCLLNNAPGAGVTKTIGDVTCDPTFRGPASHGCLPYMQATCTIANIEASSTTWDACKNFVAQQTTDAPALINSMVASYFTKYAPGDVTPHTNELLQMAAQYYGSADDVLATACSTISHDQIMNNTAGLSAPNFDAQRKWCGCHLSSKEYLAAEYISQPGQVVACDVACRIAQGVPKSICIPGQPCQPVTCTTAQCIMQDININVQNSESGNLSFVQNCGTCPGGNCECFFGNVHLTANSSNIGPVNFSQNCNNCFQINTDGSTQPIDCNAVCPTGAKCTHTPPPGSPGSPITPITPGTGTGTTTPAGFSTLAEAYKTSRVKGAFNYLRDAKAVGRISVLVVLLLIFAIVIVASVITAIKKPMIGVGIFAGGIIVFFGILISIRNIKFASVSAPATPPSVSKVVTPSTI